MITVRQCRRVDPFHVREVRYTMAVPSQGNTLMSESDFIAWNFSLTTEETSETKICFGVCGNIISMQNIMAVCVANDTKRH